MNIVLITGINGSGKSTALRALEDLGYYAIDNLPLALLGRLIELFNLRKGEFERLALVADARGAHHLDQIPEVIQAVRNDGHDVDILWMDASDEVISRRYSETRRRHPLAEGKDTLQDAIDRDRKLIEALRPEATMNFDTSALSIHDTKREIIKRFSLHTDEANQTSITIMSFGYKRGVPSEADLVFDVRFLDNPYFVEHLKESTGRDPECSEYVLNQPPAQEFLDKLFGLLDFLVPQYDQEGKAYLTIAIGCTGGRHRSVAISEALKKWLLEKNRDIRLRHRDTPEK
jgi:UPF0042 nucleotide-binding protein